MFLLLQKYLNTQVRTNKLENSVVYDLFPSILASGIHPYFFKLLRVLSLSRMLAQFSDLYIPPCVGIFFQFMVFTLENEFNICIFIHAPVLHSKFQVQFFENLFLPRPKNKGVEETIISLLKFNQKICRDLEH